MSLPPQSPYGFCQTCGTPHAIPNQAFCPTCGTAQVPVPAPAAPPAALPPAPFVPTAPFQAAQPTPPGEPPANPYYGQPVWAAMPPGPAPKSGGVNPLFVVVGGAVIFALVLAGIVVIGLSRNNSNSNAHTLTPLTVTTDSGKPSPVVTIGGVTFSPAIVDCSTPVEFTVTISLPASVQSGDSVVVKFDGADIGSTTIQAGGTTIHEPDGTWQDASTSTIETMQSDCANGGVSSSGVAVLTPGIHEYQILTEGGTLLAQGSYTVTGGQAQSSPSPLASGVVYSPTVISCSAPVAWSATFRIPASVQEGDTVVEKIDGTVISSGPMVVDAATVHETDGSWTVVSSYATDAIQTLCSNGGLNSAGVAVFTQGSHHIQIFDANGVVVAEGTYSVTP